LNIVAIVFLLFQAVVCIGLGVAIFISPDWLHDVTSISATELHGLTDLRSTYGGVFTAVGLSCLFGVIWRKYDSMILGVLVVVYGGLSVARLLAALMNQDFSVYTVACLVFETVSLGFALCLLKQTD